MKSWGNKNQFFKHISAKLSTTKSTEALAGDEPSIPPVLTDELAQWLAQLTLLYGLPVEYLAPDIRLLPTESIRFFYLDQNWLDRLVDGAMSVGVLSSKENLFNQAFFEDIYDQIDAARQNLRNKIRSVAEKSVTTTQGTMTGLLFRSQVVTAYPGVEIHPLDENDQPLDILRMDRLSNSLILCIIDGIPKQVKFVQPSEGLHFGINREAGASNFTLFLRGLGYPSNDPQPAGYPAGAQIAVPAGSKQFIDVGGNILSGASTGVIDIAGLVKNIETKMNNLNPPALKDQKLTPGGLAIQFVVGTGIQNYSMIKDQNGDLPPACN